MALNKDRNTPIRVGDSVIHPVAAGAKIYAGALVAINAAGFAVPGSSSSNLVAVGRADKRIDNLGGLDGNQAVRVRRGIFQYANAGGSITRADIGKNCFIASDYGVSKTGNSVAGKVIDIDDGGVWVEMG